MKKFKRLKKKLRLKEHQNRDPEVEIKEIKSSMMIEIETIVESKRREKIRKIKNKEEEID